MFYRRLSNQVFKLFFILFSRRHFASFGIKSTILSPIALEGLENITIGNGVRVGYHGWLAAKKLTGMQSCNLVISDGCQVGNFCHIYATHSIVIEKSVLTADKVYITDNLHEYENISKPILGQPIKQLKEVTIGEGAWIGENVSIIGASVGRNSVIGANSVVTKDIPDYCVAVGIPAKIIKQYDLEKSVWVSISN